VIYDCFTFYNEFDVLEMRLTLLEGIVDRFVLCEAPFTFSGRPKPLWYAENAARFARWHDKIVHLVYPGESDANPWANEWGQRAFLTNALSGGDPDDLVLIGDVDEIPHPKNAARVPAAGKVLGHRQRYAVGYFNRVIDDRGWVGTRAVRLGDVARFGTLADVRRGAGEDLDAIEGGWHFSSLGGVDVFKTKMQSYSHKELDIPYYNDRRRIACEFESPHMGHWRPLEDDAPALFREARWAKYVWPQPPEIDAALAHEREHAHGCFAYVPDGAPAIAVWTATPPVWTRAGAERFGSAFAGAHASVADALAALAPGSWLVADGLERLTGAELAAIRAGGHHVVAYARNSRSHAALTALMGGEPFPPGRTIGLPEARALAATARWREERFDRIPTRWIFAPPDLFAAAGRFEWFIPPFRFLATTRDELLAFLSHGFIFVFAAAS
jgi:hypothetical protein